MLDEMRGENISVFIYMINKKIPKRKNLSKKIGANFGVIGIKINE